MAYAEQSDLSPGRVTAEELIQLTDDDATDQANTDVIAAVLDEASALVDSYCRQRYTVPLQTSEQVKALALDIAVWKLFRRRRRIPEEIQFSYDEAMKFLRDVAAGKAGLDQPTGETPQSGGGEAVATDDEGAFSDDNLGGYV